MWATAGAKASAVNNSVDIFRIHKCMGYTSTPRERQFRAIGVRPFAPLLNIRH
jgi:hypothetical protein